MHIDVLSICSIFYEHFYKKRWRPFAKKVIYNIISLSIKLKPSYLWDIGPIPDPTIVSRFLTDLKKLYPVFGQIKLILVENQIILVNCQFLTEILSSSIFTYCDIGSQIQVQLVDDDIVREIHDMKDKVINLCSETNHEEIVVISKEENWCIPTLYGVLLNYPFVYWFRDETCDNNLNFSNVYSYKVTIEVIRGHFAESFILYSFSIPVVFKRVNVNKWFSDIKRRFVLSNIENFKNIKLNCDTVTLKLVTL